MWESGQSLILKNEEVKVTIELVLMYNDGHCNLIESILKVKVKLLKKVKAVLKSERQS